MKKHPATMYVAFDAKGEFLKADTSWKDLKDDVNRFSRPFYIAEYTRHGTVKEYGMKVPHRVFY